GNELTIYRAMPNTAASVSESLTCICGNSIQGMEEVKSIFNAIGKTVFINEELMNAATVVGACGIAYVLRFIRAMIQGGIKIGFAYGKPNRNPNCERSCTIVDRKRIASGTGNR